ncbi:MAG: carbohydrate kinase, partial [Bacteroidaceae bacterium]|nr:carbohydrate kinase [Bacteroidaceae bacterium]
MEKENSYVVGLGEVLFDVFPTGSKLGGAPANFAYHAGQHGLQSVAVSAVGNDILGDEAL